MTDISILSKSTERGIVNVYFSYKKIIGEENREFESGINIIDNEDISDDDILATIKDRLENLGY